ncbi:MAG TPA: hypothetical protein D7H83_00565, partial [Candidatus Poseidoniales archaeon]
MKRIFDGMTSFSTERPKTTIAIILVFFFSLAPNAMFINFDNSEDAFFPDNETVRLLNEVEDEYQASIDFIRFIDDIDSGDLYEESTWQQLAMLEAILLENQDLQEYQYPLFGIQPNSGMASAAIQWHNLQDPLTADSWISDLQLAIDAVASSDNDSLASNLANLTEAGNNLPSPELVSASDLRNWQPEDPNLWLERIDNGANLTSDLSVLSAALTNLIQGPNSSEIAMATGPISGKIGMLMGMQSIDYRSMMISNLPAEDSTNPWDSDGPVLTTFVVVTEPGEHGVEVIGDVQEKVSEWADELASQAKSETGDSEITVFSFSQLATGQNANLG